MPELPLYTIFPLGDNALTIDFGNSIDESINQKVLSFFHSLSENPFSELLEAVPAYSSLTLYYDISAAGKNRQGHTTAYELMAEKVNVRLQEALPARYVPSSFVKIPVCYDREFGLDLDELATAKQLSPEEIISRHTAKIYTVYMLGFLPGFSYMGKVDNEISSPRKPNPRQKVEAGSIGIAGNQTGIYPLNSPGGWQIIGRTPVKLFDAGNAELTLLKPGDTVQFYSISKDEFNSY